jgi:pimeloyl-ACP methyl ester carboxylesterase
MVGALAAGNRAISEQRVDVDGVGVFARRTEGEGLPVVFVHGNPTHSAQWLPFLELSTRPAIAIDLPGWGRSDRPPANRFDYSMHGLARFFGRALDRLGVEDHALVVHDWGGLALIDAIGHPGRLDRLVIIDSVPLLPGYRWHWLARWFWRVPVAGELVNRTATKAALRLISRQANARPGPVAEEFIEMVWESWGRGPRRPILDLYRSADPPALAAAGHGLGRLACPALVVWGRHDPYLPVRFGRMYAERLPNAEFVELKDAGHWPWIDRPDTVERVARFLQGG